MEMHASAAQRTEDVLSASRSFRDLLLPEHVVRGLEEHGFLRPSPVQQEAIPLARLGTDLIVQAKAGTGKTLVFAVAAVERVDLRLQTPQVVILAPTREIALQCTEVVNATSSALPSPGLVCGTFIGGLPTEEDEKILRRTCHVAVGTPGRVLALLQRGSLVPTCLRLLVLDEADKLLAPSLVGDVAEILGRLPPRRQSIATSATYDDQALCALRRLMRRPREVRLCAGDVSLLGVAQYYRAVQQQPDGGGTAGGQGPRGAHDAKIAALLDILSSVSFQQAVVFCNRSEAAEVLAGRLAEEGYPAAFLSAQKQQLERMDALNALRDFRLRVAVCSDLVSRGVDLDQVNLVINMDVAEESATHMHRVGRAGRFGTKGLAITLLAGDRELGALRRQLQEAGGGEVLPLPSDLLDGRLPEAPLAIFAKAPGTAAAAGSGAPALSDTPGQGTEAPAAAPPGGGGLLADIATASLWADELEGLGEGLPSPGRGAWPLEPAAWLTPDSPTPAVAGAEAAAAARGPASRARSALSGAAMLDVVQKGSAHVAHAPGALGGSLAQVAAAEEAAGGAWREPAPALRAIVAGRKAGSSESEDDSWTSTSDDVLSSADEEGPSPLGHRGACRTRGALSPQRSRPAAIPGDRAPAAAVAAAREEEGEQEASFSESWLGGSQGAKRANRTAQVPHEQLRLRPHAAAEATSNLTAALAAAAAEGAQELDAARPALPACGDMSELPSALCDEIEEHAAASSEPAGGGAPQAGGHYWEIVQSAAHDLAGRAVESEAALDSAFAAIYTPPPPQPARPAAGGARQRRPLGSSQATAFRRQQEEEAAAEAEAEEEEWAGEEEEEGGGEAWEGQAAGEGATSHSAWAEYWQRHFDCYGCYPSEETFASQPAPSVPPPQLPAVGAVQGGRAAGAGRPPPPVPPPPPPPGAAAPAAPAGPQLGLPPFHADSEGFVRVPAALLERYQALEWRDWQARYGEWTQAFEDWKAAAGAGASSA